MDKRKKLLLSSALCSIAAAGGLSATAVLAQTSGPTATKTTTTTYTYRSDVEEPAIDKVIVLTDISRCPVPPPTNEQNGPCGGCGPPGTPGCDSGGGDSGKVLCTYFYLKGMLPEDIYQADSTYGMTHVSQGVRNGYHVWAVPLVSVLQTGEHPILEAVSYFFVKNWAEEMAYVMGVTEKSNLVGRIMRLVGEPVCAIIGLFTDRINYQKLWI